MKAAREQTAAALPGARWGDTGPKLLTALQPIHAPDLAIAPRESTYAIGADEFEKFLLPQSREEVEARTANSSFAHLWNEMWRKAGIPKTIAPPSGCWLDVMFERYQIAPAWSDRLEAGFVERWAALRRDRDHAGHYNLVPGAEAPARGAGHPAADAAVRYHENGQGAEGALWHQPRMIAS